MVYNPADIIEVKKVENKNDEMIRYQSQLEMKDGGEGNALNSSERVDHKPTT